MYPDQTSSQPHSSPDGDPRVVELRNALTVVIGRAQLLQRRTRPTDAELSHALDVILRHSWHAAALIEQEPKSLHLFDGHRDHW